MAGADRQRMPRWLPRPVDLAAAAVLTAGAQAEVWSGVVAGPPRPVLAALYLTGTVAAAWHRIVPLATLAGTLTVLALVPAALGVEANAGLAWFVTALAVIASAGYHARRPLLALVVALGVLGATVTIDVGSPVPAEIAFAWLLGAGAWAAGRAVSIRTLRAELSEHRAALAEQDAQWRAAAAVAEERLRIARELHDVIAHGISVMTLHAGGIRRLLRPEQRDERAALEVVERTGRESLAEMRRLLGVLRAPEPAAEPAPAPGLAHVADLLEPARVAGLRVELTVTGEIRSLPPGVDVAAYRIAQEAVTNVLRHAAASLLDCTVDYGPDAVELRVVDDGAAGAEPRPGGYGHVGMRERAAMCGGTVEIGPRPGGGYRVHAVLPAAHPAPLARDAP